MVLKMVKRIFGIRQMGTSQIVPIQEQSIRTAKKEVTLGTSHLKMM